MKHAWVLGHLREGFVERVPGHAGDVLIVDGDLTLRINEIAAQQLDEGALAGAGGPDETDPLTRLYCQREVLEDVGAICIAKREIANDDTAAANDQRPGARRIDDLVRHQ